MWYAIRSYWWGKDKYLLNPDKGLAVCSWTGLMEWNIEVLCGLIRFRALPRNEDDHCCLLSVFEWGTWHGWKTAPTPTPTHPHPHTHTSFDSISYLFSIIFYTNNRDTMVKRSKIMILPTVLQGCETWSPTLREEHRPRVFVNRVLWRIFGTQSIIARGGRWKPPSNRLTLFLTRVISSTLKMEATPSSETTVYNKSTRCHVPEDDILHSLENLKIFIICKAKFSLSNMPLRRMGERH
jgi:hypothetical protein